MRYCTSLKLHHTSRMKSLFFYISAVSTSDVHIQPFTTYHIIRIPKPAEVEGFVLCALKVGTKGYLCFYIKLTNISGAAVARRERSSPAPLYSIVSFGRLQG